MLIRSTCQLEDGLFALTFGHTCLYVAGSPGAYALVDCGLSIHATEIPKRLDELGIAQNELRYLLFTNLTPPRCGGIAACAAQFPNIKIVLTRRMAERLEGTGYLEALAAKDRELVALYARSDESHTAAATLTANLLASRIKIIAEAGQLPLLPQFLLHATCASGHSDIGMLYGVPSAHAIITDQSGGYYNGRSPIAPGSDYSCRDAISGLTRLAESSPALLCLPYLGALTGSLIGRYIKEGRESIESVRNEVSAALAEGIALDEVQSQVAGYFYSFESADPLVRAVGQMSLSSLLQQIQTGNA